ncbi:Telomerase activating protein Est1, partial [Rhizoctonia solani]
MGDPSKLSRDVKGLVADFRGELKLRDPWDREIDIQFKRIQRKYKDILFGFPFARQAQAVDQSLWSDTSYALIAQYRARIDPIRASPPGNKNAVENRKMLQKFLAFLGAEGTFWSGIVSRLVRIHGLTEANGAMVALGMNIVEFENRESLARQGQIDMAPAALEDNPTPTHPPPSHEHRSNKLLVVFRALIYLGDIARYREQYGTHPNKANSEPSTKRSRGGRRGKGGGAEKLNEKPFSKAEAFYVQARLLLPDYGNPFNQLAIVHSYQHDFFGAALNYYRALCVRKPFPTAQDNLIRSLAKCLEVDREMWRERREQEASGDDSGKGKSKAEPAGKPSADNDASKDLESRFKQDVVLLHALWAGKCRPTKLARHTQNVLASFASLVTRRLLPAATIVQVLVITLGALWRVRMFRMEGDHKPERRRAKPKASDREESREEDIPLETRVVAHLLALYTVLLEIGIREIQDGVKEVGEMAGDEQQQAEKLAQRITGTFRRTLPALRIANKWVKANVRYLQQYPLDDSQEPNTPTSPTLPNTMRPSLTSFWHAWSRFDGQLNEAFPLNLLPSVSVNLEEDIDMKGFSPLKWESNGGLDPVGRGGQGTNEAASVHPNEEQLMRIGDLIVDNKYITALPGCPLAAGSIPSETHNQSQGYAGIEPHDRWDEANDTDLGSDDGTPEDDDFPGQEDDRATVSTRTDDDPVRLAMDARLSDHEDEGEDEQILYPQGFRQRPVSVSMSPPPHSASPLLETGPALVWPPPTPSFLSEPTERSARVHSHTQPRPAGTTAEDLLNRVLNGTPTFLNMATSPVGNNTSSIITSNTPFVGRSISMHGPTPSFLSPAQNRSPDPFPLQNPLGAPGLDLRPGLPRSPPQPSAFSNQRSTTFSAVGSPSSLSPGVGRTNDPLAFRSHARLPSLTGAATIWTPAPQEVARAGSWGGPSGTGPMRSNSIAGGMVGPGFASDGTWSARNQGFGDMEVNRLSRQQTYATARDIPNWE